VVKERTQRKWADFLAELKSMRFQFFSQLQLSEEKAVGDEWCEVVPAEAAANPVEAKY
jgi:hypothetical protein